MIISLVLFALTFMAGYLTRGVLQVVGEHLDKRRIEKSEQG